MYNNKEPKKQKKKVPHIHKLVMNLTEDYISTQLKKMV